MSSPPASFLVSCKCGAWVPLDGDEFVCVCGQRLGARREGVAEVAEPTPYWGEITKEEMDSLLSLCRETPWREAVRRLVPESLRDYILSPDRAAFQDLLPVPENSRILDVGAGLGAISAELARRHHVVALEGVWERARFIAERKEQDRLDRLTVLNGDLNTARLAPAQFDVVVVNGVLEWVGLFDLSRPPELAQRRFLETLRALLRPGGFVYIGIENRFGWAQMRGTRDHSGLPYTSLMPRWMARMVCERNRSYRSRFNVGYRTYTYSFRGYVDLFRRAGFQLAEQWIATNGYNLPTEMVPVERAAILNYTHRRLDQVPVSRKAALKNRLKLLMAREWFWRWFGSDYAFLITPTHAPRHS